MTLRDVEEHASRQDKPCNMSDETVLCPVPQSLWVERTTLTLVQSLPGISRWFEVDKRELVS